MKKFPSYLFFIITLLAPSLAFSVTVVLCQEENGEQSYRKSCPPEAIQINQQKYYVVKQPEPTVPEVTLYYVPDCQWCREIRSYFADQNIPIIEKDLTDNAENQQELIDKAGELMVPTVNLNDAIFKGYFPSDMDKELENFGYTKQ